MDERYFSGLTPQHRKELQFDAYSRVSTISTSVGLAIANEVSKYNPRHVVDLTAGIGGMTYELSKIAPKITSIELDAVRFDMLDHNIKTIGLQNVGIHRGDLFKMPNVYKQADLLFVDADITTNHFKVKSRKSSGDAIEDAKMIAFRNRADEDLARREGRPILDVSISTFNVDANELLEHLEVSSAEFKVLVMRVGATFNLINFSTLNPNYDIKIIDKKMGGSRLLIITQPA